MHKYQDTGRPTSLFDSGFAGSDNSESRSIKERLCDLKLIRIENGKWLLTALGNLYVDIALTKPHRPYYFLCLAICASVLSLLLYKVLVAP